MNSTTRIGKIARLPHSIREQLNLKLRDGDPAKSILPWLNSLPDAKAILAADFENRPVNKQNLSEWKHGGYRDWLLLYNASHFLQFTDSSSFSSSSSSSIPAVLPDQPAAPDSTQAHPNDFTQYATRNTNHAPRDAIDHTHATLVTPDTNFTHKLLLWTQLQYTSMARHIDAETDPERKWTALRQFANDISRLRRSTVADDFLQIQRDWLTLSQSNTADKKEKDFWKWTTRPDIAKKLFPEPRRGMTAEQMYQFEKDTCLMDGPGPEIAELMAEVRIAKRLLEMRKVAEAEAKAKSEPDYDPNRPLPDTKVRLAGMPFEELFPTIPEKPLTKTHPELDDGEPDDSIGDASLGHTTPAPSRNPEPSHSNPSDPPAFPTGQKGADQPDHHNASNEIASDPSDRSDSSNPVQPNPTKSNQGPPTPKPTQLMKTRFNVLTF